MTQDILNQIITLLIIPLLPTIAVFIINWVNAKTAQVKATTKQQIVDHYIDILNQTVVDVVTSLNQMTVQQLKDAAADGHLTADEAKQIKEDAFNTIYTILGNMGREVLKSVFDDLDALILNKIEGAVMLLKEGD